jgi:nitroreductase
LREPEEMSMVWSDIPTPPKRCVLIVICYDSRIYKMTGQDGAVGHNQLLDCAAAADHMLFIAHALGLGGVWLSATPKTTKTFKEKYGLPDHIVPVLHLAVGWSAMGSIKSQRMPLSEMMIRMRSA